jgi:predicted amidohydrolase
MKSIWIQIFAITSALLCTSTVSSQESRGEPESFKLALCQMKVVGGNRALNLTHAGEMIAEAAAKGADIILLPEAMDLGWTDPSALTEAEPVPEGKTCAFLADRAKRHGVYICSGFNSAVIINPNGELILLHRKINELDIGHPYYALGDRLNVCETEFGTLGLLICADANADDFVLTRSLAYMGADVILSPSSWAVVADHDNEKEPYGGMWKDAYKPIARDFRIWIASCSNVGWMTGGPWKGWRGIGCSMVIGPGGTDVLHAPYGEDADVILYVDVSPEKRPGQGTTWYDYWNRIND